MHPRLPYPELFRDLEHTPLAHWRDALWPQLQTRLDPANNGDLPDWLTALEQLPQLAPQRLDFNAPCLTIGNGAQIDMQQRARIVELLQAFHPWRKGPFCLYDIHLDTEWRSDWKWQRLAGAIAPLDGRLVLDVGCGNGYYGWRMLGAGAKRVIGVDPTLRFVLQYAVMAHFIGPSPNHVLPLTLEALPAGKGEFDTVFSMGVIYHRRDPLEHLRHLYDLLRPGGELVLEGLVLAGDEVRVLVPDGRYAKMKNVWSVPSCPALVQWLEQCGFQAVQVVDCTATTVAEQRRTPWMRFESLADFLDPNDSGRTIEGHPAPVRAVLTARRK